MRTKEWAQSPEWTVIGDLLPIKPNPPATLVPRNLNDLSKFVQEIHLVEKVFFLLEEEVESWKIFLQDQIDAEEPKAFEISRYSQRTPDEELTRDPILDVPRREIVLFCY